MLNAVTIDDGWAKFFLGAVGTMAVAVVRNLIHQALMDKRLKDVETKMATMPAALDRVDRRTLYMLQLMAEMAKAGGLDRRVPDDLIIKALTEDD